MNTSFTVFELSYCGNVEHKNIAVPDPIICSNYPSKLVEWIRLLILKTVELSALWLE